MEEDILFSYPILSPATHILSNKSKDYYLLINTNLFSFIRINNFAKYIIEKYFNGKNNINDIIKKISDKYKINYKIVKNDIINLTKILYNKGFIIDISGKIQYPRPNIWPISARLEEVWLHVTNSCNLHCLTCYKDAGRKYYNELTPDEIKAIFEEITSKVTPDVIISGGEPLIRKDIIEILEKIRLTGIKKIFLITNGTLLNDEITKKLANLVDFVQVSLDGSSAEINDKIRGKGVWNIVMRNIQYLKKYNIKFSLYPTINKINSNDLPNMIREFSKIMGRKHFACALMIKAGRGEKNYDKIGLTPEEIDNLWENIHNNKELREIFAGKEGFYSEILRLPSSMTRKISCGAGSAIISIDANGDMYPCHLLMRKEFLAGNLREKSFWEIYSQSPILRKIRSITVENRDGCSTCSIKYLCGGGCIADTYYSFGNFYEKSPICNMIKKWIWRMMWGDYNLSLDEIYKFEDILKGE